MEDAYCKPHNHRPLSDLAHPMPIPESSPVNKINISSRDLEVTDNEHDIALMLKVGSGDELAFGELIERHQSSIIGTVAKMLGNPSDAEDIAQQVFIRLWRSAPRYKPKAKFTTFLFTITRNLVFNESRRKSRKKEFSMQEREDNFHLQTPDQQTASPDQDMLQQELRIAIDQAISRLPKKQRMAVILRRYENMPYDEIGEILGLSRSAIKSQIFRARIALREDLKQYLDS
ncbi:MAG: RNA polymerase sigma factor [Akkermansiaceae bacterium]